MSRHSEDLKKFQKDVQEAVSILSEPSYLSALGKTVLERVINRTRLGRGVRERGGASGPLKSLSSSYKEQRKKLKQKGELSGLTTPGKSNLTQTGKLLDSADVTSVKRGSVTLGFRGNHDPGLTNETLAGYVSKDRPFFNLSQAEEKALTREIENELQKLLNVL